MTKAATNTVTPAGLSPARKTTNLLMGGLIVLATAVVVAPLILIFAYLLKEGVSALNADFFTKVPAPEGEKGGGLLNAILGSLEMLAMASVIGVTVGVAGGIFLSEYPRHPLMPTIRMLSDVLAGIPAIVMGLVAYGLMVLTMGRFSGLAGALALGFLMIPIVVRTTEEVLKLVPMTVREAGVGLGLPKWLVTMKIVLPAAAGGIITGVMLALARVAGEAAPLLFTAFGNNLVNLDPTKPMSALPLEIYRGATSAYDENQRMAKAGALLLILMIFLTSMLARRFGRQK
ncbi:phosphate ABC transporter permease PstA [Deinococcus wulumuqiensis]|uniref:Phosphate transport system permease protein PstA n=2 Tax=Deinococcus wulumuqiensis TaxID=980427 RepID=A0A345IL63_9DEIO|nr:phosphate ABC transporter permease PstA [Deinococcus wulumuqiensis]AXH00436.1 phosphate ABC transporter permease PstA [Deinococcus wulumuqiensis]QII22054.1 phosphate ABC transporter permease PstA [Deinococcus wulumuqiensis R12]GGI93017.1 phosphate transport system permease protein PstA [Deinococcus wulumuqiensis]GGP31204.1 phosphate transport system permease protein PstA [Deinococcus wulumuqiensis]